MAERCPGKPVLFLCAEGALGVEEVRSYFKSQATLNVSEDNLVVYPHRLNRWRPWRARSQRWDVAIDIATKVGDLSASQSPSMVGTVEVEPGVLQ